MERLAVVLHVVDLNVKPSPILGSGVVRIGPLCFLLDAIKGN